MLKSLSKSAIAAIILGIVLVVLVIFGVNQWQANRTAAAKGRLEQGQAKAAQGSAQDAIATQGAANARETANAELTADNERSIRNAKGANEVVDTGVHDAGLSSLCKRAAYRGSEQCLRAAPPK